MPDPRVRVPDSRHEERVALNTRVHPAFKRAVAAYAAESGLSIQATVEHLLSLGLQVAVSQAAVQRWANAVAAARGPTTTQTGEGSDPLTGPDVSRLDGSK